MEWWKFERFVLLIKPGMIYNLKQSVVSSLCYYVKSMQFVGI